MKRGRPSKPLEYAPSGQPYLGSAIRQMRQAKKIGLRQFAAFIPCSPGALSSVENNQATVSSETLERIAELLGADAAELAQRPLHPRISRQQTGHPEQLSTGELKPALETLTAEVQELKAEVVEVKAIVRELSSILREAVPSPVTQQAREDEARDESVAQYLIEQLREEGVLIRRTTVTVPCESVASREGEEKEQSSQRNVQLLTLTVESLLKLQKLKETDLYSIDHFNESVSEVQDVRIKEHVNQEHARQ